MHGEPGIGKTRLLQELTDLAGEQGHRVVTRRGADAFEEEMRLFVEPTVVVLDDVHWAPADRVAELLRRPRRRPRALPPQRRQPVLPARPPNRSTKAIAVAIGQELEAFSEPARRLAFGAAVAGDPAPLDLAAAAAELSETAALKALDEVVAAGLPHPAGPLSGIPAAMPEANVLIARALAASDAGEAAELAQRAVECAAYAPLIAAEARLIQGRALARENQRAEAIEVLTDARTELGVIGAHRLRDEAALELRRLGRTVAGRQRRATGGAGLDSLSGREREVAELVALGHSNREIAAELFLSEKTVEGHLTNVFGKFGVGSRAAVAAAVAASSRGVGTPAT